MISRMIAELFRISRREKRALMMIKPPGYLGRVRILEIHNHILVAVKQPVLPGVLGAVCHPREREIGAVVETLAIETIEQRSGCCAVETTVVKAESNLGHRELTRLSLRCLNSKEGGKPSTMNGSAKDVKRKGVLQKASRRRHFPCRRI